MAECEKVLAEDPFKTGTCGEHPPDLNKSKNQDTNSGDIEVIITPQSSSKNSTEDKPVKPKAPSLGECF